MRNEPTPPSPRRVFIFGAGASMDYRGVKGSLFLDAEFFRVVEEEVWGQWCAENDMGPLGKFQPVPMDHTGAPWDWPSLKAHIATRAGKAVAELGMEEAFGLLSSEPGSQFTSLCRAIELALFWRLRSLSPDTVPSHVAYLRHMLHVRDTVLTLNYDPLLEVALAEVPGLRWDASTGYALRFDAELSGLDAPSGPIPERPSDVLLLKLHGSMNWLVPAHAGVVPRKYLLRIGPNSFRGAGWKVHQGIDSEPLRPLFVPPEPEKDYKAYGLDLVWASAREALRASEELYIVGYSFPKTDAPMAHLVSEGASHLQGQGGVHFVTRSQDSEAAARFKRLFPRGVVHGGGLAAYVNNLAA